MEGRESERMGERGEERQAKMGEVEEKGKVNWVLRLGEVKRAGVKEGGKEKGKRKDGKRRE